MFSQVSVCPQGQEGLGVCPGGLRLGGLCQGDPGQRTPGQRTPLDDNGWAVDILLEFILVFINFWRTLLLVTSPLDFKVRVIRTWQRHM